MTRAISAFEAPALLDAHPTLTRYSLYERLIGSPQAIGRLGLASCLADGAMRFAQAEYRWEIPVNKRFEFEAANGIKAEGRAFVTKDAEGPLLVTFLHMADFLHRSSWGKSGVPPYTFQIQANWIMWLADMPRMAFLVLSDKRLVLYEVQRDQLIIDRLIAGIDAIGVAIDTQTPPPVDAEPESPLPVPAAAAEEGGGPPPANLDDLVRRFRMSREAKSMTANTATFAEQASDAAASALKAALPQGSQHELDGIRTYHNAKTGRLTEEKIDGTYF